MEKKEDRLSFDFEDLDLLDRDALIDEAAEVAGSLVTRGVRDYSFGPETDVLAVLADLKAEKAAFGPSPEVLPLDAESLAARGVTLDARVKALLGRFDFYAVTFPVILFPRRGWAFNRLECQVELNPGEPPKRRPLAHDIFPASSWETLANATMRLEIGITEGLKLGAKAALPPIAEAGAEARLDAGAGFAFPLREYQVRKARIVSRGKDDCEVFWRLDDTHLFEKDDLPLGVILKVPRGVTPVRAKGVLVADRSFQTLSADLGVLMRHLSERVRSFFRKGAPLTDSKEWELVG
jgi:hypothetical protein